MLEGYKFKEVAEVGERMMILSEVVRKGMLEWGVIGKVWF